MTEPDTKTADGAIPEETTDSVTPDETADPGDPATPSDGPAEDSAGDSAGDNAEQPTKKPSEEFGGRGGLDPTRYGDWEKGGRAIDF